MSTASSKTMRAGERTLSARDREALAAFPDLARLIELRDRPGWVFMPKLVNGECDAVQGMRVWPQGFADTLHFESAGDAAAQRVDFIGAVTWSADGSLVEVIDKVIEELVSPDDPTAPRLVQGFAQPAPGLWRPPS